MKYLTETSKAARYDKIVDGVEKAIHKIAEDYIYDNGDTRIEDDHGDCHTYRLSEEQLDNEAYEYAFEEFLSGVEELFGAEEVYWIIEIILQDLFEYEPSKRNPYAIRKSKGNMSVNLAPYGISVNISGNK